VRCPRLPGAAESLVYPEHGRNYGRDADPSRPSLRASIAVAGRRYRHTFASLKKSSRKLGVRFWDYLQDRVRGLGKIPCLADLIRQKARQSTASNRQAVPAN
jgi:hypothetical protein